jgi:hypothetical protein
VGGGGGRTKRSVDDGTQGLEWWMFLKEGEEVVGFFNYGGAKLPNGWTGPLCREAN